jgi:GTP-binding protein
MIVSILQLMGFPMGKPVHSRAEETPPKKTQKAPGGKKAGTTDHGQPSAARRQEVKTQSGKSSKAEAPAAKPKVADYPFTTLVPNLGVVDVDRHRSFVMADIPGLIEGAAEGAGLGIRFLKHLARTRFLSHLVDIAPVDGSDPVENITAISLELEKFSPALAALPRWLVLNKIDLALPEEVELIEQDILERLDWQGPVFKTSGLTRDGAMQVCYKLMEAIEEQRQLEAENPEFAEAEAEKRRLLEEETRQQIQNLRAQQRAQYLANKEAGFEDDDWDDDDDGEMEVIYQR